MGHKILVVSSLFPLPTSPHRGQFVSDQVRLLVQHGHDVRVIAPVPWLPKWAERKRPNFKGVSKSPSYFEFENIPVYSPRFIALPKQPFPQISISSASASMKKVLKFLGDWVPDIIHIHTLFPIFKLGKKLSEHYSKPLVATVHGWDFDYALNYRRLAKHQRKSVVMLDKLVTINEKHKEVGVKLGISEEKVSVIPCHVHVSEKYQREFDTDSSSENCTKLNILFPADPNRKEKDYPLFVSVINELEKRSIKSEVKTLGGVEREKVWEMMHWADIALLTSFREGSPQVVKEALKCGCKVVSTDVGDVSDYLPKEAVSKQRNPEHIADNVEAALNLNNNSWNFPAIFEPDQVLSKLELIYDSNT